MWKNYLKIAWKVLLRRKFFTFISLFAISFTLIVLMLATAVLENLLGAMPPETRAGRTLGIHRLSMRSRQYLHWQSTPGYRFLNEYVRDLAGVEEFSILTADPEAILSYQGGSRKKVFIRRTDGAFWRIMDFTFLEGGPYTEQDDRDARFVAVINETTRRKFFGNNTAAGSEIEADGQRFRVVGVVQDVSILRRTSFSDVWVPIGTTKADTYRSEILGGYLGLALARDPGQFPLIKQEFQARLPLVEMPATDREYYLEAEIETLFEFAARSMGLGSPRLLLAVIILLMVLFMILPTVNLVNINLSRIMERTSEIGIRKACGASSRTLVGQFIAENLLLTLIGGLLGFIGSLAVLHLFSRSGVIPYAEFQINLRIFIFALLVTLFFGLFSGAYPAWRMSRLHPVDALRGGAQ